jgi:nucleotide-binding universal stress UspA family protein
VVGPACANHFGPLKSIVFATNLTTGSLRAAQYANFIAETSGAMLTLVHVLSKTDGGDSMEAQTRSAIEQLTLLAPDSVDAKTRSRFEVAIGHPGEQILHLAGHAKANLIVMGVHEHGGTAGRAPWATLSEVIRHARCPVLAVRPHLN